MNLTTLSTFLDGGRVAFSFIVALAFIRLGRTTADRLYYGFAVAFFLLALSTALVGLRLALGDYSVLVFLPRLFAFVTIIVAIIDKNRRSGSSEE
jgi:hypothetical protein